MKAVRLVFLVALMLLVAVSLSFALGYGRAIAGPPGGDEAGNNLSYPVIWAEGVEKTLPGTTLMTPTLAGEWWWWWGTTGVDPDIQPLACAPDPDNELYCDDGIALNTTGELVPADNLDLVKAFVQKDPMSVWQAETFSMFDGTTYLAPVNVDYIDWGDNLESVDWYTRSQVRTEVVLFEDAVDGDAEVMPWPALEYEMRHVSGWGIDEVHGLATSLDGTPLLGPGTRATVYSPCARLTIQKLLVERDDPGLADLEWVPAMGWTESVSATADLINEPIYNMAVYEGGDGPGYYSAEINVKGRVIYGYTWNVRKLNEGAGNYRITFSFDSTCPTTPVNTFFVDGTTQILVPLEEVNPLESGDLAGGTPVLDTDNNLTYIDIRILERSGGGGGH